MMEKQRKINFEITFEQPGVKHPGTPKTITFFPAHKSAMFTLFAGESSNKSALGILSPSCKKNCSHF